jgi:hypothetical protein
MVQEKYTPQGSEKIEQKHPHMRVFLFIGGPSRARTFESLAIQGGLA